jgi:Protein of unknown function (DUF1573)
MKKILILSLAVLGLVACATKDKQTPENADTSTVKTDTMNTAVNNPPAAPQPDPTNFTTIEWLDPTTKDLGKLKKDKTIEITYRFRNSGDKNLIIENVTAQCGCTIPEKPQQPFAPGEEGVIKATFNGSGQGVISKQVYVKANTRPSQMDTLTFRGEIKQ